MLESPRREHITSNFWRERGRAEQKKKKKMPTMCALCNSPARMYCESDQASLCRHCDSKVHGANFLVARHCRSLLCHVCQSPTPWSASGTEFGPTVTVCRRCACEGADKTVSACGESESQDERSFDGDEEEEEEEIDSDDEVDDEDGVDIQVGPWCSTPPPATSSSSVEEYSSGVETAVDSPISSLKRAPDISSDLRLQEDVERRSKRRNVGSAAAGPARLLPELTSVDVYIRPDN